MASIAMTTSFLGGTAALATARPRINHHYRHRPLVVNVKAEASKVSKDINEKESGEIVISSGRRDLVFGAATAAAWSVARVATANDLKVLNPIQTLPFLGGRRERNGGEALAADVVKPFIRVAAISGSLSGTSRNSGIIRAAIQLAQEIGGISVTQVDITRLPILNTDDVVVGVPPSEVQEFRKNMSAADAILLSNPEYNYSASGAMKNAIDWGSYPDPNVFNDKPAALVSTGYGFIGGGRSQYQIREMGVRLNLHFINQPELFIDINNPRIFDEAGNLIDQETIEKLKQLLLSLKEFAIRLG